MGTFIRPIVATLCGLLLIGCTGTGGPTASETSLPSASTSESTETVAIVASTVDEEPVDSEPPVTLPSPTDSTTTTTATATTTTTTTTTTSVTTSPAGTTAEEPSQVFQPGDVGAFTSPSGNIACVMAVETGVSCYIAEKNWTIDQPDDPFCEESDWGNAVDVTAAGVEFPCYTDFAWNPGADVLAYGDRMEVGPFGCTSRESGVTCDNGSDGFELARRQVKILIF